MRQIIFTAVNMCKTDGVHCVVSTDFAGTKRDVKFDISHGGPTEEQIVDALTVMAKVLVGQVVDKSVTGLRASLLPKIVDLQL